MTATSDATFGELLRVPPGPVELSDYATRETTGFDGKKKDGKRALERHKDELDKLQEQLYAHGRTGGDRRLLLVLKGMDTSGKGGVCRHVVGQMDPQGVKITVFKTPPPDERRRGFLWRIRVVPQPGDLAPAHRAPGSHGPGVAESRLRHRARTQAPRQVMIRPGVEKAVASGLLAEGELA